jgi:hypothetical protein
MLRRKLFSNLVTSTDGFSIKIIFPTEIVYRETDKTIVVGFERLSTKDVTLAIYSNDMHFDTWDGPRVDDEQLRSRILERLSEVARFMKINLDIA